MPEPRVLVLTGYGINCDEETAHAFRLNGGCPDIVHVNDLIEDPSSLDRYQIFVFPGGFSYGDDTGSGRALANRIKNNLLDRIRRFTERDTLMLGICNGFQVMVNIGVVPALNGFTGIPEVSLEHNKTSRYECRWVDLKVDSGSSCVFTRGIESLHVPVAHGEGNFYASPDVLARIESARLVAMRYVKPDLSPAEGVFPCNPNGAVRDIAAISDASGRIMGMMPHPERALFFTQRDDWTLVRETLRRQGRDVPEYSDGMKIFSNAVAYFK